MDLIFGRFNTVDDELKYQTYLNMMKESNNMNEND
ncbi:hypothetical protein MGA3_05645 [Bacillus methanolicus MGA3]|uniref:Uncharacterized protein n=1 Tax=Bacillus methanolicus (strain MGA3 / ATCC 53907) TaxID=796606 RepID=I3E869_BACMM|nr:hypothetical protein BMMGA3_07785 [Bacillus methanolicus MGA3]EIJ82690.1 hypothetical protein MGA3_05645 [Bacillus methanolicus MGA3]